VAAASVRAHLEGIALDARSGARRSGGALALDETEEPAALFYALARRGHVLADAWALLPDLVALGMLAETHAWTDARLVRCPFPVIAPNA